MLCYEDVRVVFLEGVMGENMALAIWSDFVETVEVELADEWSVIGMFEMFGEYFLG
jgi:hypothetical protein